MSEGLLSEENQGSPRRPETGDEPGQPLTLGRSDIISTHTHAQRIKPLYERGIKVAVWLTDRLQRLTTKPHRGLITETKS